MVFTSEESAAATSLGDDIFVTTLARVSEDVLHAMLAGTVEACRSAELDVLDGYQRQAAMIAAIGEFRFPGFKDWHDRKNRH